MRFKLIASGILLTLLVIFALQNIAIVELNFLFWSVDLPRSMLLFVVLLVGFSIGWTLNAVLEIGRPRK